MKYTANLNLKKPDGTDVVDIQNFNDNADIIDLEVTKKATQTQDGRMSKEDKTKLEGIEASANNYLHPSSHSLDMITETTTKKIMSDAERTKLAGIADNANKYVHPASHPASVITQDITHRFVTDAEKSTWNSKASTSVSTTTTDGLMSSSDKTKLDGVASNANNYIHPSTHPSSMITQDSSHRFVTDSEKASWNAKPASQRAVSDSVSSTSSTTAASSKAAKTAYDKGVEALNIANTKLNSSAYTAADVLTKIKTIDGAGSGLNADLLDGVQGSVYGKIVKGTYTGNGSTSDRVINLGFKAQKVEIYYYQSGGDLVRSILRFDMEDGYWVGNEVHDIDAYRGTLRFFPTGGHLDNRMIKPSSNGFTVPYESDVNFSLNANGVTYKYIAIG